MARLRWLREAGLLLTLSSVLAVISYYAWRDAVRLGPEARPSSTRVGAPPAVSPSPEARQPRRSLAGHHGLGPPPPPSDSGPPIEERPPVPSPLEASPVAPTTAPDSEPPPPGVQPLEDAPHQALRANEIAQHDGSPDLRRLPTLKAPTLPGPPAPTESEPETPIPTPSSSPTSNEPPRLLVGDEFGRVLVSRLYARTPMGPIVLLPDGSLGWPDGEVPTTRPFQPWSSRRLSLALRSGPFRGFRVVERAPYLVLTRGSDRFAEDAADLLQGLYRDLVECLEDGDLSISEPEFPLVAIIFPDEKAFRAYRPVDPDVRAYYEGSTNRIILFEESDQDRLAPELARLRRPQAIAHEGVHQILQNIGIQPRLSCWPAWLVEGLAEYFAPTATLPTDPDEPEGWGDYGRGNFGRVNPFHMATLMDLRHPVPSLAPFPPAVLSSSPQDPGRLALDASWVRRLLLQTELSPTDYALSWSLTHYLARCHPEALRSFLLALGRHPPLEYRPPEYHLRLFIDTFGLSPEEAPRRIDSHLSSLRYERVPFYGVRFEQAMGPGRSRRAVLVSPSPIQIDHWVRAQTLPDGGPVRWWATPFDSRTLARHSCEAWLLSSSP
ncbi:DUF1570 domain-containing protein [Tautonia sociabilis]|nr:DUF1570 domain-containing protein [Tautonia sociabilis]